MTKNISNKEYSKLDKKYKDIKKELDSIKKTNMYFYSNKMPLFVKKWLFNEKQIGTTLNINTESVDVKSGKVSFIINTISYDNNLKSVLDQIINLMYINYEVILLCTDYDKYNEYTNIDKRIQILKFPDLKEKNNTLKNIRYVCKLSESEYYIYMNDMILDRKFNLKKEIKLLNGSTDLIVRRSKINDTSYSLFFKKQCEKSIFENIKVNNLIDVDSMKIYKNIKINLI